MLRGIAVAILMFPAICVASGSEPYELFRPNEKMHPLKNPDDPKSRPKKYIGFDDKVTPCPDESTELRFIASDQLNSKYNRVKYEHCYYTENRISYQIQTIKESKYSPSCKVMVTFVCGNGSGHL